MELQQFDSRIEEKLYKALKNFGIPPLTQYKIGIFRVDMAYPEKKLAIECDGFSFHTGYYYQEKDRYRQSIIESKGWHFERFQGWLIYKHPEACAAKIAMKYFPNLISPAMKMHAHGVLETFLLRTD